MTPAPTEADDWVPACGGTETPFRARTGRLLLYMWNRTSGTHAYYDLERDEFLSAEDAALALGIQ